MSKTLLVAFFVFTVATRVFSHNAIPMAEQNLASTILKSGRSLEDHPQRSVDCFATYLPRINEATNAYEAQHNKCLQTAANSKEAIEAEVAADRANVHYGADGICSAFKLCSDQPAAADFFDCYNVAAGEAISTSYEIQTVSKNKAQYINQKYQTVSYDQKTCTDTCSDAYIQETSSLYAQLDACLQGYDPPTTTAAYEPTGTYYPTPPNST